MCQMSVFMDEGVEPELLLENVTALEVAGDNVVISTLFEGTKEYENAAVSRIDFTGGKVFLKPTT